MASGAARNTGQSRPASQGQTYVSRDGRVIRLGKPHADRARQFLPFAALTGFYDLIRDRERIPQPFHELAEDEAEALSRKMAWVKKGTMVDICFYDRDAYVHRRGMVSRIDEVERAIWVVKERVPFDMILDISAEGMPSAEE